MYTHHRNRDRILDPMMALVSYDLEQRHRQAERQLLVAQARAARPASASAVALLCRWLGARLPAWARAQQTQADPARSLPARSR